MSADRRPPLASAGRRWPSGAALLLALLLCLLGGRSDAQPMVSLDGAGELLLHGVAEVWLDADGTTAREQVMDPGGPARWRPLAESPLFDLRRGQAVWLRFALAPSTSLSAWFLELPYAPLDRLELHQPGDGGRWTVTLAGDRVPVRERVIAFRHPLLPVVLPRDGPVVLYARLESPHGFAAMPRLVRQDVLLAMVVAAVMGWARRDRTLAVFTIKLALLALGAASISGLAGLYLWPHAPQWNDLSPTLFTYAVFVATAVLTATALAGVPGVRPWRVLLLTVAVAGAVGALAWASVAPHLRIKLVALYMLAVAALSVALAVAARRRGDPQAIGLVWALLPLLLSAALPVARALGVPLHNLVVQYGLVLGTSAEIPILLLVLLRRSQDRPDHQRRLLDMRHTDPTTGLPMLPVFIERGQRMILRSQRFDHQGLVLLVDIVAGRALGHDPRRPSEWPLRVAARLQSHLTPVDVLARLAERRFGLVLEGPVTPTLEASMAPRLVASCLLPYEGQPEGWLTRVRVAYAMVPLDGGDMARVVQQLDSLLTSVPAWDSRTVFTLTHTVAGDAAPSGPAIPQE